MRFVGMLDAGIVTDLETMDPTPADAASLENADLIISTGCIGHASEISLERLLRSSFDSRPRMAHVVLHMFDFGTSKEMLTRHGYVTEKVSHVFRQRQFPQRQFVSAEERQQVLDRLERMGIDATGVEATGWHFAELHVARPEEIVKAIPLDEILGSNLIQIA